MRCPTGDELVNQAIAALPRGRAWRTHRQSPEPNSVLFQFWRAFADVLAYVVERTCALRLEFWCATHTLMHDEWLTEYGLPDECDPFPDLCTKVSAIGGTRCEYYAEIAARAGWVIDCSYEVNQCGDEAGCAEAGCAEVGGFIGSSELFITVFLDESPAYTVPDESGPYSGNFVTGGSLACEPDIEPLKCILERVVHAHITILYVLIGT